MSRTARSVMRVSRAASETWLATSGFLRLTMTTRRRGIGGSQGFALLISLTAVNAQQLKSGLKVASEFTL